MNRNTLFGLLAILLWSTAVGLARSITEQLGPFTGGASVYLTGGLIFALRFFLQKSPIKKLRGLPRLYLFGCGALFVIYTVVLYSALGFATSHHQALEVSLVNYLWPALTILFSLFILSKRGSIGLIPGTLFALGGIFLVLTQGASVSWNSFSSNIASNPVVYGLGLVAAVSWALYSNLARRWAGPNSGGAVFMFILASGFALLLLQFLHPETGSFNTRVLIEVAVMSVTTTVAYALWDAAMRKGDVILVAACSYFTPLFSTVFSCVYLRIAPGAILWLGCLLIIAGSFLSWRSVSDTRTEY